jgi:hypothetical protein
MSKEAIKMAIEFLSDHRIGEYVIEALEEALAKQEQGVDWKDMYEKEKRRSAMWVAKYEKDIGPLEYATPQQEQSEPLEYWNAVEGWVKIDELRYHFDSVSCATIYKNGGEGRVPLCLAQPKQEQGEPVAWIENDMAYRPN